MSSKYFSSNKSFLALILLAISFYTYFIYKTIFFIDGQMYFTLVDDAMISMNYAKHLADGYGMVWNIGEAPVQGFTNMGWMLYMSLLHLLPVDPSKISFLVMITSIVILLSVVSIVYAITRNLYASSKQAALLTAIITTFYFPLVFWTLRGMEVGLVTLLVYLSVFFAYKLAVTQSYKHAFIVGLLMFGAIITRFDSATQIGLIILYLFFVSLEKKKFKINLIPVAFYIFALLGLLSFQYLYFGDILPNTYHLKVVGVSSLEKIQLGINVFFDYAIREFSPLLFVIIGGLVYYKELRNKKTFLLLGLFFIQVTYSIYVGGDYAEPYNIPQVDAANRFITQGMPALFIIFSIVIIKFIEDLKRIKINSNPQVSNLTVLLLGGATLIIISSEPWYKSMTDNIPLLKSDIWRAKLGVHINKNTDKDVIVAVHATGQIPYYSDRNTLDLLGKSDSHIAKLPPATKFRPGHNKWNYEYSIGKLQPDLIADEWGKSRYYLSKQTNYKRLKNGIWIRITSQFIDTKELEKNFK
ncbi:hypothetical protein CRU87_09225 [Aliarcobacter trophiarum LMG 25534]|uniref:Membrane protein n=1 Tax=Aliarcobacter trophiarum LMG 25534 TaxID=1032241 RepID=A0AAD0VMU0_9BACT|nr:hypothetical protein [Aliarcobacter trophiarum]AXK49652.1 putative membrane protein [Aliarcobacter trophiarum LMG 25534]RXJ89397.1 hypothetical protein CRU87_09225 [Aliarcobacter trophiarum LMG 25534]